MKIKERAVNKKRVSGVVRQTFHNVLKVSHEPAESKSHRMVKFMLMEYCIEHGLDFHTEATFSNGSRADFIVSDWALVIEVLNSETRERFEAKDYPLPIVPISAGAKIFDVYEMMNDLAMCNGQNWEYYAKRYWGAR